MDRLELVEENGKFFWLCCKRPGGACDGFRLRLEKSEICKRCIFTASEEATEEEILEFQIDEELSKIIMAGANSGVKKWLFCTHYRDTLWTWAGCLSEGGCCTDILWSMDEGECYGCNNRATAILNHTGFKVSIDDTGQVVIKKY